jgi:small GTP-binding protein
MAGEADNVKVITVGRSNAGKTCLLKSFQPGWKYEESRPTIGVSTICVPCGESTLQFWDTAGTEQSAGVTDNYVRQTHIALLCFNVDSKLAFEEIGTIWYPRVKDISTQKITYVLVATKCDMRKDHKLDESFVSKSLAESWAAENEMEYFETSALERIHIQELFDFMAGVKIERRSGGGGTNIGGGPGGGSGGEGCC